MMYTIPGYSSSHAIFNVFLAPFAICSSNKALHAPGTLLAAGSVCQRYAHVLEKCNSCLALLQYILYLLAAEACGNTPFSLGFTLPSRLNYLLTACCMCITTREAWLETQNTRSGALGGVSCLPLIGRGGQFRGKDAKNEKRRVTHSGAGTHAELFACLLRCMRGGFGGSGNTRTSTRTQHTGRHTGAPTFCLCRRDLVRFVVTHRGTSTTPPVDSTVTCSTALSCLGGTLQSHHITAAAYHRAAAFRSDRRRR